MDSAPWGGSEELWFRTALHLQRNRNQVLTCIFNWGRDLEQIKELIKSGVVVLKFDRRSNQPKKFYKRVIDNFISSSYDQKFDLNLKKINDFKPDVICVSQGGTFDINAYTSLYNFLIKTTTPYFIICQHNSENGGILTIQRAQYEKTLLDKANTIFFVSERNLQTAERQLAYKIKNTAIISNPVNIKNIGIQKTRFEKKTLQMACVARLETSCKGQDLLIQALSTGGWKKRDFNLNLYGSGPDMEPINKLIEFYDLSDKIKIIGHVNNIDSIWANNQVLILSSISEGMPLSIVEAMLSGRPVLSTDVGDISKYVKDGITGFLAPTASPVYLSQALENLWNSQDKLDEMGQNAYNHAISITDLIPEITLARFLATDQYGK